MFKDNDKGQTQYCPMCEEWAKKYERLEKEHSILNNKYNKVLELALKGLDSYEYCINELEKENEKLKQLHN